MVYLGRTIDREFYFGARKKMRDTARTLRKSMTQSEKIFWQQVRRNKILGMNFRRQHPINQFIVDFYCHAAKLVIEIDGSIHEIPESKEHDENRSFELEMLGLKVLRFSNDQVQNDMDKVIELVTKEVKDRLALD